MFQVPPPQAFDFLWQPQLIEFAPDIRQIENTDILRPAMRQYLTQQPALLEWVAQINRIRTPNKVARRVYEHRIEDITTNFHAYSWTQVAFAGVRSMG
ncbi:MAG: hypothetical protein Q8L87_16490 [Anaerolineales bacterium]|nr:hypothetical protein [Anaerolineales bacterium]